MIQENEKCQVLFIVLRVIYKSYGHFDPKSYLFEEGVMNFFNPLFDRPIKKMDGFSLSENLTVFSGISFTVF